MGVKLQALRRLYSSIPIEDGIKSFKDIPGPRALPLIGGMWKYFPFVGNYDINRLHEIGFKMQEEFGSIVKENHAGVVIVNVFDPVDIETVYKSEGKYPGRKSHEAVAHYRLSKPELYNTGGLLPTNGSEWWRLRSAFQKSLSRIQDVRLFLPSADKIIQEFLSTFIGKGVLNYNFLPVISRLNLELTWSAVFGDRLGSFDSNHLHSDSIVSQLIEATETANSRILPTDMTVDIWTKVKTSSYKKLEKSLRFIEGVAEEQLINKLNKTNKRTDEDTKESTSLIDNYLNISEVDIKDIRGMISDLLLAGIDTTSYTACFVLYHLSQSKRVQQVLKKEALRLLPHSDSPVTPGVLNDAIYTRAILKESFRLNPIATGISRNLAKDAVLSGYNVPKGTLIITHNLVACRSERHFRDPNTFLPERWVRGSKEYCSVSPYLVLPFSHGLRTCIARRLAEQNLLTFLLKVGRNYSLDWKGPPLDIVTPLICKPDNYVSVAFKPWK